jgi:hypothetical protein
MRNLSLGISLISFMAVCSSILTACGTSNSLKEVPSLKEVSPIFEKLGQNDYMPRFDTINPPAGYGILSEDDLLSNWYGWSVELESQANFDALPEVIDIYRIVQPKIDYDRACKIAKQAGFDEPVMLHERYGYYYIESSEHGRYPFTIYQNGKIGIYYGRHNFSSGVPPDEDCIHLAENWLELHDFFPTAPIEVIDTQTSHYITIWMAGREQREQHTETVVTFLLGVDGYELYGMHLMVSIGGDGNISEIYINAPSLEKYTAINIKEPELALDSLQRYLQYPPDFFGYLPECQIDHIERKMTITEVTLNYFPNINWPFIQPSYFQPVYIFKGLAYPESSDPYPFVARVDAVDR